MSVGLESYSGLGALSSPSSLKAQEHYLFEVVNLTAFAGWELHASIGQGLTRAHVIAVLQQFFSSVKQLLVFVHDVVSVADCTRASRPRKQIPHQNRDLEI